MRSIGIPLLGFAEEGDELAAAVGQGRALVDLGAGVLILGCGSILGLE